jgi:hypothetical protein
MLAFFYHRLGKLCPMSLIVSIYNEYPTMEDAYYSCDIYQFINGGYFTIVMITLEIFVICSENSDRIVLSLLKVLLHSYIILCCDLTLSSSVFGKLCISFEI